jgi:hypothetical protein
MGATRSSRTARASTGAAKAAASTSAPTTSTSNPDGLDALKEFVQGSSDAKVQELWQEATKWRYMAQEAERQLIEARKAIFRGSWRNGYAQDLPNCEDLAEKGKDTQFEVYTETASYVAGWDGASFVFMDMRLGTDTFWRVHLAPRKEI